MYNIQFTPVIYIVTILLHNHCAAWVLPMVKYTEIQKKENAENLPANATTTEDPKGVIGIEIIKFKRADPAMQIFDFDMDLARKFAYSEWQKLLSVYVPVPDLQVEEIKVSVPARELPKTNQSPQSKILKSILPAKLENDEDGPRRVAKALQDMHGSEDIHKGLK